MVAGNIDILVITETKFSNTFPQAQFSMNVYSKPSRLDRVVTAFVREDVSSRHLNACKITKMMLQLFWCISLDFPEIPLNHI